MNPNSVSRAILVLLFSLPSFAQRDDLLASIASREKQAWEAALQIWEWAEPGYQEERSAKLLGAMLRKAGFKVTTGVAEIPTAFVAEIGSGGPIIGILGEYDALPGLNQEAVTERKERPGNGYGHGCGHHLFGVASATAAIALGEQIKTGKLEATVRFYGCPAEEGGSAKTFMARAGLFDDCDAVLHWHPASSNTAGDASNLARIAAKFRFRGVSAHAASAPEQGRSALDAVELMNYATELLREHTPDFTRIHHVITAGGGAPNVVPEFAEVVYYIRHPNVETVRKLYTRLVKCAEGAALATGTTLKIEYLGGTHNMLPNETLSKITLKVLEEFNDLTYTEEERGFAEAIQSTLQEPKAIETLSEVKNTAGEVSKSSTDVGDVSWIVPTAGFTTACWAPGTPGHSWQATACGATTLGKKGMMLAARVLAATAWDLVHDPATMMAAKKELDEKRKDNPYNALLDEGQKPPLDYRNAPGGK